MALWQTNKSMAKIGIMYYHTTLTLVRVYTIKFSLGIPRHLDNLYTEILVCSMLVYSVSAVCSRHTLHSMQIFYMLMNILGKTQCDTVAKNRPKKWSKYENTWTWLSKNKSLACLEDSWVCVCQWVGYNVCVWESVFQWECVHVSVCVAIYGISVLV